ncbi:hypothetical protein PV379_26635 [Streptomyces caniscabiei]|uniref:hypothetical protein n=1 Tax=Streptomyces caniscabiei TaxID=2746961 RepID=UPI0029AF1E13|nr:hypothetical protein [Streptomyces caniscabiei]MDX2604196.1 hypothetical protein [Streptomyces caniscabiei]MDX2739223.1 hypothetical protein [Streptomyces caniscabiei]MDX2780858.1 hypothetical protein [Streptomyces caniscabiei]
MNSPEPQTPSTPPEVTDHELARRAAELAVGWVSAATSLSKDRQDQGWQLVALQHSGSGHMEMYAWEAVETWERRLAETLATADDSAEDCARIARAKEEAVSQMRDMLLSGIRTAEQLNAHREEAHRVDPRADLRRFISRNE